MCIHTKYVLYTVQIHIYKFILYIYIYIHQLIIDHPRLYTIVAPSLKSWNHLPIEDWSNSVLEAFHDAYGHVWYNHSKDTYIGTSIHNMDKCIMYDVNRHVSIYTIMLCKSHSGSKFHYSSNHVNCHSIFGDEIKHHHSIPWRLNMCKNGLRITRRMS